MELYDGCGRWDQLRSIVHWARMSCDSIEEPDEIDFDNYNRFLKERQKNPIATDISFHESTKRHDSWLTNKSALEKSPLNDYLVKEQIKQYRENYPKTGRLRKTLIANDRFSLNKVTPKLTSNFEKSLLKLKSFICFL